MPIYFFHVENCERITGDEGVAFPDDQAALREAALIAADLSKNQTNAVGSKIVVINSNGDQIGEVPFPVERDRMFSRVG
jgi:hypothetical protein